MGSESIKSETEAVAEIVRSTLDPQILEVMDPITDRVIPIVIVPDKMRVEKAPFEHYRDRPVRRAGVATAGTLLSFIDLVKRSENEHSAVFATRASDTSLSLTSVLDYNEMGPNGPPHFGKHRIVYSFPVSEEWKLWLGHEGLEMPQDVFAAFIEARVADLGDPETASPGSKSFAELIQCPLASPSRILELSRGLSVRVDSTVGASVNLTSGEKKITYTEGHNDESGQPIKVPGAFLLSIPVFVDDGAYSIPVRLSYKVRSGRVVWSFALYRADVALDDAFKRAVKLVEDHVCSKVYFGSPEA